MGPQVITEAARQGIEGQQLHGIQSLPGKLREVIAVIAVAVCSFEECPNYRSVPNLGLSHVGSDQRLFGSCCRCNTASQAEMWFITALVFVHMNLV